MTIRRMTTISRMMTIRRMMTMTTLVTLKYRRLQYSDEREDYHNHMDTSRLIEEEAQYNAWTSISPFSSLFRSTLSITVIIFVWQLYHSLWISDIPCGWSLMMINVLAVLTKSVCTNRRLHKKSHLTRHVVLLKDAICNLCKTFAHLPILGTNWMRLCIKNASGLAAFFHPKA